MNRYSTPIDFTLDYGIEGHLNSYIHINEIGYGLSKPIWINFVIKFRNTEDSIGAKGPIYEAEKYHRLAVKTITKVYNTKERKNEI